MCVSGFPHSPMWLMTAGRDRLAFGPICYSEPSERRSISSGRRRRSFHEPQTGLPAAICLL